MATEPVSETTAGLTVLQKVVLALFSTVLVGSVALRAVGPTSSPSGSDTPAGAQGLVATGGTAEPVAEPGPLEQLLPYLTEAGLFGLIGFALGYTSRKLFKLALIALAIAFVAVQGLVHLGWLEVDWGGLLERLNAWLFNLRESATVSEFLTDRVPSGGALLVGWLVGFKRG